MLPPNSLSLSFILDVFFRKVHGVPEVNESDDWLEWAGSLQRTYAGSVWSPRSRNVLAVSLSLHSIYTWTRRLFKYTELSLTGSSKFAKCNTDSQSCLVMLLFCFFFSFCLLLSFASVVSVSGSSGRGVENRNVTGCFRILKNTA